MSSLNGNVTDESPFSDGGGVPPSPTGLPYLLPFKIRRIWLAVTIVAVVFFISGLLLDLLLIHLQNISQVGAAAVLDAVFAIVVGGLIYRLLVYDRERRMKVVERLETIDEMNHHIRNALQVISFNVHPKSNETELAEIKSAMNRIQWALREILPKVEPEFNSFEGSARENSSFPESPKE